MCNGNIFGNYASAIVHVFSKRGAFVKIWSARGLPPGREKLDKAAQNLVKYGGRLNNETVAGPI